MRRTTVFLLILLVVSFLASSRAAGELVREWWLNIGGTQVADLVNHPSYPDSSSGWDFVWTFESPQDWDKNFGSSIRGILHPPQTGQYTFWIASDDASQLLLSTDASALNAQVIAYVEGWTARWEWDKYATQQSDPITLEAGQQYYIAALYKEGDGDDHVGVAWEGPGELAIRSVIDGAYTTPSFEHPLFPPPLDVTQPGDPIVGTSTNYPGGDKPEGPGGPESPPEAIDNNPATKYLNFDKEGSGFTVTPSIGATYLEGIALTTANDAPARDPNSVTITGSNDGENWLPIVTDLPTPLPNDRFEEVEFSFTAETAGLFEMYRVIFPTLKNSAGANSMQIAEVRLMGYVPEPATLSLLGLAGLALLRRKRR